LQEIDVNACLPPLAASKSSPTMLLDPCGRPLRCDALSPHTATRARNWCRCGPKVCLCILSASIHSDDLSSRLQQDAWPRTCRASSQRRNGPQRQRTCVSHCGDASVRVTNLLCPGELALWSRRVGRAPASIHVPAHARSQVLSSFRNDYKGPGRNQFLFLDRYPNTLESNKLLPPRSRSRPTRTKEES